MSDFIPVKSHIKEQPQNFHRFGARWTPTQLILDPDGVERHRIEGFLPKMDLLGELELGLGKMEFALSHWPEAEKHFRSVQQKHPNAACAAEACYWEGVSEYKRTNKGETLAALGKRLRERYPGTEWARRGEVW